MSTYLARLTRRPSRLRYDHLIPPVRPVQSSVAPTTTCPPLYRPSYPRPDSFFTCNGDSVRRVTPAETRSDVDPSQELTLLS